MLDHAAEAAPFVELAREEHCGLIVVEAVDCEFGVDHFFAVVQELFFEDTFGDVPAHELIRTAVICKFFYHRQQLSRRRLDLRRVFGLLRGILLIFELGLFNLTEANIVLTVTFLVVLFLELVLEVVGYGLSWACDRVAGQWFLSIWMISRLHIFIVLYLFKLN